MFGFKLSSLGIMAIVILGLITSMMVMNARENATIRKDTTATVSADIERKTWDAINGLSNKADQARLKLNICRNRGQLYDFVSDRCEG